MNRIDEKFQFLKQQHKKGLITFVTAGDPTLKFTKRVVIEMEKSGADLIELGIPFSDPIAEGPVIQEANKRALKNNVTIDNIFELVKEIRKETQVPLIFLLYYNCIFKYGHEAFFSKCSESGVDAVIVPDLPYEESGEVKEFALNKGVYVIDLVSPVSGSRIKMIACQAKGFLYCVSSLGVTGMRTEFSADFESFFKQINENCKIPTAIGFGISSAEHVEKLKRFSDALIVGSAIVKRIGAANNDDQAILEVSEFVTSLREALDK